MTGFLTLAGIMGAAGIMLAAAGFHLAPGTPLGAAADMLLFHAVAVLGGVALLRQGALSRPLGFAALAAWELGAALFAGGIALLVFTGHRAFAIAAPFGGSLLIAGWLLLTAAAVRVRKRIGQ